jgi:alpha-glucosidase
VVWDIRFMATVQNHGRDPDRTPTQWSSELYAGFSSVRPWLPLADDFGAINVEASA